MSEAEHYVKLTLSRTEPSPATLAPGTTYDPKGDVIISLRALDSRVIQVRLSLRDWTDALRLNKPVTAWVSGEQEESDVS